ncbi:MAG: autoinducer binding domain-containing protein [Deltaproteobacteria bacterium]|nr:autoinducer binding domain-containing protein [Deltaproteobacteria bacterium]
MDYREFSRKELMEILDIIQSCVKSNSESDIIDIASRVRNFMGADNGICALGDASTGRLVRIISLNYPAEWAGIYMGEELYKTDPVIKFNYEFYKTHYWSEAEKIFNGKPYADLMNRAAEFGLKYGVASGVNGSGYRGSIFSFSRRSTGFDGHEKKFLDILTPHIHQALVRVDGKAAKASSGLSEREKEVLAWMKEGKTNWEISAILNISERTVKFHVHNIETKLNAVNKAHAIAIAMNNGLVL